LRNLRNKYNKKEEMKMSIDVRGDPRPWISYVIFNKNGTERYKVEEYPDISTENDTFYEGNCCLDASECLTFKCFQGIVVGMNLS